jgi:heme/copper-type cytochrome/quinol oxidase subunit 2
MNESAPLPTGTVPIDEEAVSAVERRARRSLILGLTIIGLLLVGMVALLVVLAVDAYRAAPEPSPGAVVVSLIRDAAIVLVAFETLLIGALMLVLTLQIQALVALLRDEIRPMLEAINETLATVRGTAQFMSHNVVSPTIRAAGFLAGLRRVAKEVADLARPSRRGADER